MLSMCGIAGVVDFGSPAPSRESLVAMAAALHHRGPDEQGIYRAPHVGLAHARLSIIDLATGQQPLVIDAGADELAIAFNGEIFNYVELRAELVARHGARFQTQSDTEVALVAYKHWGEAAFARFNGQFAIAIWEARARRLVLARDRLGVRPLYLHERGARVTFASEVKAIFAGEPGAPRAFDPAGLGETFTFWTVVPPQSVFAGITELRPGHVRTYEAGRPAVERAYWHPSYAETFRGTVGEAAEALRAALAQATKLRMLRADVTVGSYLSGGLDSSVVAALAKDAIGDRLKTFSLRFTDAEYDETPYQREMVARLGSEHAEVMVSRADIAGAFAETVRHTERPLLRTAPAPLLLLARLVRDRGIKVVLTGEGADEMLAGYDLFREARVRRFWAREPQSTRRPRLLERLYPYLNLDVANPMTRAFFGRDLARAGEPDFAHAPRWRSAQALQRLFVPALRAGFGDPVARFLQTLPPEFAGWDPLARDQYVEVRTLLSGYLLSSQGDRVAMASSIEGRFPFLDIDVVALANSLPADYKLRVLDEKHVLKRAAHDLVAPSILARPKQPYRAPDALAFTAAPWVPDLLAEASVAQAGVFEPRAVAQLWGKCRQADQAISNADNMALVGVISTQLLHRELIARSPLSHLPAIDPRTVIDRVDPA